MKRQEFIKSEIELEPNNPLNYYLLAIEYRKSNEDLSLEDLLEFMLERFSNYLPIYYFYAEHLFQNNKTEKALNIAEQGIALAEELNNIKLVKELNQLIAINC